MKRGVRQRTEHVVWRVLAAVAESDARITAEERDILRRYRRALGVRAEARPEPPPAGRPALDLSDISMDERIHVLRMMFRVAFADGRCSELELLLLRRLAGMMGLSGVQFADVQVSVEQQARTERRGRKWRIAAAVALAAAVLSLVGVFLARRQPEPAVVNEDQLAVFKRLERDYAGSVLLIRVDYDLVSGDYRKRFQGTGTGFFVTASGLIATNKHVIEPWKFEGDAARLLGRGYQLDLESVRVAAWTGGSRVFDELHEIDYDAAFDSRRGTLRIAAAPDDRTQERFEQLADGTRFSLTHHVNDDSDLAVLRAGIEKPVQALPLADDPSMAEKLDPVMVLGFPTGPAMLEAGTAEVSPSLGEIRKVENSLFISAPIVEGNSGGPVIDRDGKVIGVATRTASGEATLGGCILSRHVLALLEELQ